MVGLVACSSEQGAQGGGAPVATTITDTSLALSPASAATGTITFTATNDGSQTHELYIFRTDLPADQLPVADGKVSEDVDGVEFIAEVEDIAPGTSKDLTEDLAAGSYVLLCNIPGHYEAGIRAPFEST
jgi:uncharacterized cupredoxin-like copper-binding protein